MTQDNEQVGRRSFMKKLVAAAGISSIAGCGGIGGNNDGAARTVEIPGYENRAQFEKHERILNQKAAELDGVKDDYSDAKAGSQIDGLLLEDEEGTTPRDIRVGLSGEVSANPDNLLTNNPDLNDLVHDPEYILSTSGKSDIETLVDQTNTGDADEQEFTNFDSGSLDVQGVVNGIQDEYGLIDDDMGAVETAVQNLAGLNVFAATNIDSEQPAANPEALNELSQEIDETLGGLEEVYHEAKDAMAEVDQYQNDLASGLASARNRADGNDNIQGFGYLEPSNGEDPLLKRTGAVNSLYNQTTEDIAADIARLETTKRVLDKAYDRASAIEDAAGDVVEGAEVDSYDDVLPECRRDDVKRDLRDKGVEPGDIEEAYVEPDGEIHIEAKGLDVDNYATDC